METIHMLNIFLFYCEMVFVQLFFFAGVVVVAVDVRLAIPNWNRNVFHENLVLSIRTVLIIIIIILFRLFYAYGYVYMHIVRID